MLSFIKLRHCFIHILGWVEETFFKPQSVIFCTLVYSELLNLQRKILPFLWPPILE